MMDADESDFVVLTMTAILAPNPEQEERILRAMAIYNEAANRVLADAHALATPFKTRRGFRPVGISRLYPRWKGRLVAEGLPWHLVDTAVRKAHRTYVELAVRGEPLPDAPGRYAPDDFILYRQNEGVRWPGPDVLAPRVDNGDPLQIPIRVIGYGQPGSAPSTLAPGLAALVYGPSVGSPWRWLWYRVVRVPATDLRLGPDIPGPRAFIERSLTGVAGHPVGPVPEARVDEAIAAAQALQSEELDPDVDPYPGAGLVESR